MKWDRIINDIMNWNWITLLLLSLLSFFLLSPSKTLGIIIGGFLIIANFNILQNTLHKAFENNKILKSSKISIVFKFYFRFLALGLIMAVIVLKGWVDPCGLAIGLSTVVLAIVFFGISMALKTKGGEVA